jgi:hypothetical protein
VSDPVVPQPPQPSGVERKFEATAAGLGRLGAYISNEYEPGQRVAVIVHPPDPPEPEPTQRYEPENDVLAAMCEAATGNLLADAEYVDALVVAAPALIARSRRADELEAELATTADPPEPRMGWEHNASDALPPSSWLGAERRPVHPPEAPQPQPVNWSALGLEYDFQRDDHRRVQDGWAVVVARGTRWLVTLPPISEPWDCASEESAYDVVRTFLAVRFLLDWAAGGAVPVDPAAEVKL